MPRLVHKSRYVVNVLLQLVESAVPLMILRCVALLLLLQLTATHSAASPLHLLVCRNNAPEAEPEAETKHTRRWCNLEHDEDGKLGRPSQVLKWSLRCV